MPCKDTSAKIKVLLSAEERLLDFDYEKITCSKKIGGTGFREYCVGRSIDEISHIDFHELLDIIYFESTEEQFYLYLEWDALRAAIAQYRGKGDELDQERYQLSSIVYDEGNVEICQITKPPKDLPKVVSCSVRARQHDRE